MRFKVVRLCKEQAMSIVPQSPGSFDLHKAGAKLAENGYEVIDQGVMVIAKKGDLEVTMYRSGRLLVHPAGTKEEATEIAESVYDIVEGASD